MHFRSIPVLFLILALLFIPAAPALGGPALGGEVSFQPAGSIEDYESLYQEYGRGPNGAAALFVAALIAYMENQDLGMQCFTAILDDGQLADGDVYQGKKPDSGIMYHLKRIVHTKYLAYSYVRGTSPETGYAPPAPPYTVALSTNKYSQVAEDRVKLFVKCSGADSPRPISLKKGDDGFWKVTEASSLFVGIRSPKK